MTSQAPFVYYFIARSSADEGIKLQGTQHRAILANRGVQRSESNERREILETIRIPVVEQSSQCGPRKVTTKPPDRDDAQDRFSRTKGARCPTEAHRGNALGILMESSSDI